MRKLAAPLLLLIFTVAAGRAAEDAAPPDKGKPREDKPVEPRKLTTEHRLQSGGTDIAYLATAEDVFLRDA